jgi:hypothetical protein
MSGWPEACPGTYRKESRFIFSNQDQVLASPSEIQSLVENVFRYMNGSWDHDVRVKVNVHSWLVRIHPFADGNSRIVTLVSTFPTLSSGCCGIAFTHGAEPYFGPIRAWDSDPKGYGRRGVG